MPRPNDGGPAYPAFLPKGVDSYNPGMTLRDWFAGQALAGILAFRGPDDTTETPCDNAAGWAFEYADAMLAERGRSDAD